MKNFEDFMNFHHKDCGMPLIYDSEGEQGGIVIGVICCECGEPIYYKDWEDHDWNECPICGYETEE